MVAVVVELLVVTLEAVVVVDRAAATELAMLDLTEIPIRKKY